MGNQSIQFSLGGLILSIQSTLADDQATVQQPLGPTVHGNDGVVRANENSSAPHGVENREPCRRVIPRQISRKLDHAAKMRREAGHALAFGRFEMPLRRCPEEGHAPIFAFQLESDCREARKAPFEVEFIVMQQATALFVTREIMLDDYGFTPLEQRPAAVCAIVILVPAITDIVFEERSVISRGRN